VWVDDPKLSGMVILDPQWLARLMATLITSKMNFVNNGILERKNLHFVWKPPEFPDSLHSNLVNLLEQFEILYRMPLISSGYGEDSEKYLLMCLVNDKRPPIEWPRPGMAGLLLFIYLFKDIFSFSVFSDLVIFLFMNIYYYL